ncbi:MAG: PAS domain S-box protein [Phycisphaerales bacterium]|nr:PAS domain S-box protein [Phycisphaerales bacterium]
MDSATPRSRPTIDEPRAHDNAERLRAIVETAVDGIITIDENGTVETMNPAAVRMFGYVPEDVIGRNISRLMPEPFRSEHDSYLLRYLKTGERRIIGIGREVLGQRHDGSTFPMELAVSEMHLEGRRMFTGIVRDVTERRASEEKLRRLAALLDDSSDAIKSLDLTGHIIEWNAGAERMYGYPETAAIGMSIRELLPVERSDEMMRMIDQLKRGERIRPFETQRVAADGRLVDIWCTITLLEGRDEEPDTIVVTDRDITERKRGEMALHESEARTRAIVEAAVDGIITINEDGVIESANPAAERLFGYTFEELIGSNVSSLMPAPYCKEHDGYIRRYVRNGVKKIIGIGREVTGLRKDGSTFPMDLAISELQFGERRIFTGIVRDITERKRFEHDLMQQAAFVAENNRILKEARSRAEEATAAKSSFLANMSHEIRTPMTAVLGFAEQLQRDVTEEERAAAVETILRNGRHLLEIINDILDLSKIESGQLAIERLACSPVEIAFEIESLMRVRSQAKGIEFMIEFDTPMPQAIKTDPTRLKQILINLVGNGIKFTDSGSVELHVGYEDGESGRLWFDVVDTGIGLTAEQVKRLFQPFVQADESTTRQYGGTGLGLAISQRLAGLLDGEIKVESQQGGGCNFRVEIGAPRVKDTPLIDSPTRHRVRPTSGSQSEMASLEGLRILVAEDGPDNRRLLDHLLRSAGATVKIVEDGRAAMEVAMQALEGDPFDVIVMDMQMPVLDGYEATRSLRRLGYARPVIALTAHAMSDDRQKCMDVGCDEYLTKPIDRLELTQTIARVAAAIRTPNKRLSA